MPVVSLFRGGEMTSHWGSAVGPRRRWHLPLALLMGGLDMLRWRKFLPGIGDL